jgi:hypothetical protein
LGVIQFTDVSCNLLGRNTVLAVWVACRRCHGRHLLNMQSI